MVPLDIFSLLNRYNVNDPKKAVDASIDFLLTVVKGHFPACACKILGITSLNLLVALPPHIFEATIEQQRTYITSIAKQLVHQCTLVGESFINKKCVTQVTMYTIMLDCCVTLVQWSWNSEMDGVMVMATECLLPGVCFYPIL